MISEFIYRELTTTRKLTSSGDKFSIWKSKIDFVLSDIGVSYVIQQPRPNSPTESSPEDATEQHKQWVMDDFTCRHAILSTLEDNLIIVFDHGHDTAKQIMDGLVRLYGGKSIGKSMCLYEQFKSVKITENENVMECVVRMIGMGIELEMYGMNLPEEMRVVCMLDSLPESWDSAKDAFLKMQEEEEEEEESRSQLKLDSFLRFVKNQVEMKEYFKIKMNGEGGRRGGGGELIEGEASSTNKKKPRRRSRRKNTAGA